MFRLVLALAVIAVSACTSNASAQPSATPTARAATLSPAATATPTSTAPPPTASPAAAVTAGTVTGRLGVPNSDYIPPVTVYAIGADDQRVWYSVEFPGYALYTGPTGPTRQPGTEPERYTLTGVAPGTYWVVAYRNDGFKPDPGVHTREAECLRRTPSGPCPDQTPVVVTVTAGQTTREIDIVSWYPGRGLMPPPPPRPTPR